MKPLAPSQLMEMPQNITILYDVGSQFETLSYYS